MYNSAYKELVGKDKKGKELYCGDVCRFITNNQSINGMIVYDDDSYAFAFVTLSESTPVILMHCVDAGTITYEATMIGGEGKFMHRNDDFTYAEMLYCEDEEQTNQWAKLHMTYDQSITKIVKGTLGTFPMDACGSGEAKITDEDIAVIKKHLLLTQC